MRQYVPIQSVGGSYKAPAAADPVPKVIATETTIFKSEGENLNGGITLRISGKWKGRMFFTAAKYNQAGTSFQAKQNVIEKKEYDDTDVNSVINIDWQDASIENDTTYSISVVIKTVIEIAGEEDNQFKATLEAPSTYQVYNMPNEPMEKTDVPLNISPQIIMPWTEVKGQWTFGTTGIWNGGIEIRRSIDGGATYVVIASKESEYNSNMSYSGAEIDDGVSYQVAITKEMVFSKEEYHFLDWRFSYGDFVSIGIAEILAINTDATGKITDFIVGNITSNFGLDGVFTADWALGSWYEGNYPKVVVQYQDRLIFANSNTEPQTIWASRIGDYSNFGVNNPIQDDDSINVTLSGSTVNEIRSMLPIADLMLMTNNTEYLIRGDNIFSPLTIHARPQGFRGSTDESTVNPLIIGNSILFVVKDGKTVRDLGYILESDGYDGSDLTIFSKHIFENKKIVDMDYQQNPNSIAWFVGNDGTLASLTYVKEQQVWAWTRHITDGKVKNICSVNDKLYLCVQRGTKYFIEYIDQAGTHENFLDASLEYHETTPIQSISNLQHLAGRTVTALADGMVFSGLEVSSDGALELDRPHKDIVIGLPYKAQIKMLPLVGATRTEGLYVSRRKKLVKVFLNVYESHSFFIGDSPMRLYDALKRLPDDPLSFGSVPYTGWVEVTVNSDNNRYGSIYIIQDRPLALSILGIDRIFSVGNEV
jgi:hypothetical protein